MLSSKSLPEINILCPFAIWFVRLFAPNLHHYDGSMFFSGFGVFNQERLDLNGKSSFDH